jgi:hypothetical protein
MVKSKINKEDFKDSKPFEKLAYLMRHGGDYAGHIEEGDHQIALFVLSGFYVEVFFDKKKKEIEKVELLREEKLLNQYVEKINIADLLFNIN